MALPEDHMFNIGLYRENVKKSSCLKLEGLEPWYLVCRYVASPSRALPSLSNYIPGANGPALGSNV